MRNKTLGRVVSLVRNPSAALRQGENTMTPQKAAVIALLAFTGLALSVDTSKASPPTIPDFRLPWPTDMNNEVKWTGGPHQYGNLAFSGEYPPGLGSGLDFIGPTFAFCNNQCSFQALSIAEGDVVYAGWGDLGNQVAVRHSDGGSVAIYGHLYEIREGITVGSHVLRGEPIGRVGRTNTEDVHLHLELRDGDDSCQLDCVGPGGIGGNPLGWDQGILLDGYTIHGYYILNADQEPVSVYNYDGSAVRGDFVPFYSFRFVDYNGTTRFALAKVSPSFQCNTALVVTCESNTADPNTTFAVTDKPAGLGGGEAYLASTNTLVGGSEPPPGDITAPRTSASFNGTEGNNGWYVSPVPVVLSAFDETGVAHTYYQINGGEVNEGTSFTLTADAIYEVCFWSVDVNSNTEAARCVEIKIDTTPPVTTGTATGSRDMLGVFRSAVANELSATDNLSGVASTETSFDGGSAWDPYGGVFTLEDNGVYEYLFRSVDVAGNVEQEKSSGTIDIQRFTLLTDSLSSDRATTLQVSGVTHSNGNASFTNNTTVYLETLEYLGQFSQSGNVTFTIDNLIQTTQGVQMPLYPLSFYRSICTFIQGPITVSSTSPSYNECWYVDDDVTLEITGATGNLTIVSEGVIYDESTNSHLSAWDTTNGVLFWARRGYVTESTGAVYQGVVYAPFASMSGAFTNATFVGGQFAESISLGSGTTLNAQQAAGFSASVYTLPLSAPEAVTPNTLYVSSTTGGTAGGVSFADEDVLAYNREQDSYTMLIDGSDIGLGGIDIDAFAWLSDGTILLSFDGSITISGLGKVYDADIVAFTPTSLGLNTAGSFAWYFDGSDVGLTTSDEDIDAIGFTPDGKLVVSTLGSFSVSGASGNDEDLLAFTATQLGETTTGVWAMYFDGSDVGLSESLNEDVNGVWIDEGTGQVYLTTVGSFSVSGVAGDGADIFVCTPSSLGSNTACTYGPGLYWDGSKNGFVGEVLDAFEVQK